LHHRLHHHLAVRQRQHQVGIGQLAPLGGDVLLARDLVEDLQDTGVQHVPRTDLLFDHHIAGGGEVKGAHGGSRGSRTAAYSTGPAGWGGCRDGAKHRRRPRPRAVPLVTRTGVMGGGVQLAGGGVAQARRKVATAPSTWASVATGDGSQPSTRRTCGGPVSRAMNWVAASVTVAASSGSIRSSPRCARRASRASTWDCRRAGPASQYSRASSEPAMPGADRTRLAAIASRLVHSACTARATACRRSGSGVPGERSNRAPGSIRSQCARTAATNSPCLLPKWL